MRKNTFSRMMAIGLSAVLTFTNVDLRVFAEMGDEGSRKTITNIKEIDEEIEPVGDASTEATTEEIDEDLPEDIDPDADPEQNPEVTPEPGAPEPAEQPGTPEPEAG
ncbi:MAG: hypothetical protein ILA11_04280 [Butyrivibrio sp.]|nr:hypothetical protein [Butyrivibrio sp.]